MASQFRTAGHEIVATAKEADLAVVNTCSVTAGAASDSRGAIRRVKRLGAGEIIVTGCWATLEPQKAGELSGVHKIVPNLEKDGLVTDLLHLPQEFFYLNRLARQPLPGLRHRTRAFIKIQDGCNNRCTFCITTIARGVSRSRSVEDVITDIQSALDGGTKEIILTGVHLGMWGQDFLEPHHLSDLVSILLDQTMVTRLHLSSLEPWDLDADFFHLWDDPRLCRHLHLPLQSGSSDVLCRMGRKTMPDSFAALVISAQETIPDAAITTDVMVGFPGETEAEFVETLDFVNAMKFAGGHVFTFSARPGTVAARLDGQVRSEVQKERSAILRDVFSKAAEVFRCKFIGRTMPVLWESAHQLSNASWKLEGLTDNYLRVAATASEPRRNKIDKVKLDKSNNDCLTGSIISD